MKIILFIMFCLVNSAKGCDETIEAENGTITSPNYPDQYPNAASCTYTILVPEGMTVLLTFTAFDIEPDSHCSWDFITINGGDRVCGESIPPPMYGDSNVTIIYFESDGNVRRDGFSLTFTSQVYADNLTIPDNNLTIPDTTTPADCNVDIEAESGLIASPNYPNHYPNEASCTYTITAPQGKTILLNFTFFEVEQSLTGCGYDYVMIDRATHCGFVAPAPVTTSSNTLTVVFVSDVSQSERGFSASFTTHVIIARTESTVTETTVMYTTTTESSVSSTRVTSDVVSILLISVGVVAGLCVIGVLAAFLYLKYTKDNVTHLKKTKRSKTRRAKMAPDVRELSNYPVFSPPQSTIFPLKKIPMGNESELTMVDA